MFQVNISIEKIIVLLLYIILKNDIELQDEFQPVKYFSIDRVFRNENLDATHLAEFHQIEGVVADRGLSLSHLIGVLDEFFRKLGLFLLSCVHMNKITTHL